MKTENMNQAKAVRVILADARQMKPCHLDELSEARRHHAARYKMSADRQRSVAAGLLTARLLPGSDIYIDECGKPRTRSGACFNLSHSGDYAAIALGDNEVGVDIEAVRLVNPLRLGKAVFCENELALLRCARDRLGCFYDLWTKKEALLKCMGKGFYRSPKSVDVSGSCYNENGVTYYYQTFHFADYTLSVCSLTPSFSQTVSFLKV